MPNPWIQTLPKARHEDRFIEKCQLTCAAEIQSMTWRQIGAIQVLAAACLLRNAASPLQNEGEPLSALPSPLWSEQLFAPRQRTPTRCGQRAGSPPQKEVS
jgi:hypothetical protein